MTARRLPWLRFVVVGALLLADLWSKQAVFAWLGDLGYPDTVRDAHGHERLVLVNPWFSFMLSRNEGAAFGRFADWPQVLVGGRILAVIVLGILVWRARRDRIVQLTALVLVLAGALGNLYDNLALESTSGNSSFGAVRDFIDVYFARWDWHFPTFNVADSCISVGAVLLILSGLFHREHAEEPSPVPPAAGV